MIKNILYNALSLLSPKEKKQGTAVIGLLFMNSLFDFFSVAAFVPLLILVIDPHSLQTNTYLKSVYEFLEIKSTVSFALALTMGIAIFTVVKTLLNTWVTYKKASFAYDVGSNLSYQVARRYLHLSYYEFTQSDAASELNRITNLPIYFANNILIPGGTCISEGLVCIFLIGTLAIYNAQIFLFLILILIPAVLLYQKQRKSLLFISTQLKNLYPSLIKNASRITDGYPDIKAFQKDNYYQTRLLSAHRALGKIFSRNHTLHASTIRLTELLAACWICTLIFYAFFTKQNAQQTITNLSLYAGAMFRVIPSVNRILSSIIQIKSNGYVIDELKKSNDHLPDQSNGTESITFHEKIELKEITFNYPGQKSLFDKLSLTIKKGQKIVFTGKSGEGKTTLLLMLLRFINPQSGQILVDGIALNKNNSTPWQNLISYVPQNPYILDASIAENVAFGFDPHEIDRDRVSDLIREVDLQKWVETLPLGLQSSIGENGVKISGGQRQRIALARALYRPAEVLLLDEVTNQLDPETEKEILAILKRSYIKNKTIVVISHQPELIKQFDAVYEIKNGTITIMNPG